MMNSIWCLSFSPRTLLTYQVQFTPSNFELRSGELVQWPLLSMFDLIVCAKRFFRTLCEINTHRPTYIRVISWSLNTTTTQLRQLSFAQSSITTSAIVFTAPLLFWFISVFSALFVVCGSHTHTTCTYLFISSYFLLHTFLDHHHRHHSAFSSCLMMDHCWRLRKSIKYQNITWQHWVHG